MRPLRKTAPPSSGSRDRVSSVHRRQAEGMRAGARSAGASPRPEAERYRRPAAPRSGAALIRDRMLKPRTEELYRGLLAKHLLPFFGNRPVGEMREPEVRRWHKERLATGSKSVPAFGPVTVAKAYRLLHAILATAADDGLIRRNPCRIKGAGQEDSAERPVVPVAGLVELLKTIPGDQAGAGSTRDMSDRRHATQAVRHAESHPVPPDTNLAGPALRHRRCLPAHTHRHATGTPEGQRVRTPSALSAALSGRVLPAV